MEQNSVISIKSADIYHAQDPFAVTSSEKLIKNGVLALSNVNIEIKSGELVYLIGRVGSGKSTLLKILYADIPLVRGEAKIAGFNLKGLKSKHIPLLRRKIGVVFQDYNLLTDRNVFMNLHYVMRATGWKSEVDIRRRIAEVLSLVGLQNKEHKMTFELSGGEQQRLVIARALLNKPQVLLADEPTGNLDPMSAKEIMDIFKQITQSGCAVVMSTHNISVLEDYPARIIRFNSGAVEEVTLSMF